MQHYDRRSFLKIFGTVSSAVVLGSVSYLQVFFKSTPQQKYTITFTYVGKDKETIDTYFQHLKTQEFIDFKNYWTNIKNVEKITKRTNDGSTLISTHIFQSKSDLYEFWEAAKYIPGKAERAALGISREFKVSKIKV
jgi:hypothetical protein